MTALRTLPPFVFQLSPTQHYLASAASFLLRRGIYHQTGRSHFTILPEPGTPFRRNWKRPSGSGTSPTLDFLVFAEAAIVRNRGMEFFVMQQPSPKQPFHCVDLAAVETPFLLRFDQITQSRTKSVLTIT
jgi:hypothetical protein